MFGTEAAIKHATEARLDLMTVTGVGRITVEPGFGECLIVLEGLVLSYFSVIPLSVVCMSCDFSGVRMSPGVGTNSTPVARQIVCFPVIEFFFCNRVPTSGVVHAFTADSAGQGISPMGLITHHRLSPSVGVVLKLEVTVGFEPTSPLLSYMLSRHAP